MPGTYNLYPGLKSILEDRRTLFGVSESHRESYLKAEAFVVDLRCVGAGEIADINATYKDLALLGLAKVPYPDFILHVIHKASDGDCTLVSFYIVDFCAVPLFAHEVQARRYQDEGRTDPRLREGMIAMSSNAVLKLIVMLATKGVVKTRHEAPKSRALLGGKPHKKGSGAYTILHPPEDREDIDNPTGKKVRAHFRRGHIRRLHPTDKMKWVWVSPCFIHGEPEVQRKAYLAA